jgi:hypothetical protein
MRGFAFRPLEKELPLRLAEAEVTLVVLQEVNIDAPAIRDNESTLQRSLRFMAF